MCMIPSFVPMCIFFLCGISVQSSWDAKIVYGTFSVCSFSLLTLLLLNSNILYWHNGNKTFTASYQHSISSLSLALSVSLYRSLSTYTPNPLYQFHLHITSKFDKCCHIFFLPFCFRCCPFGQCSVKTKKCLKILQIWGKICIFLGVTLIASAILLCVK